MEMMQKAAEMNSRRVAPVAPLTSVEVEVVREPPKSATDERRGGPGRDGGHPRRLACLHVAFGDEFNFLHISSRGHGRSRIRSLEGEVRCSLSAKSGASWSQGSSSRVLAAPPMPVDDYEAGLLFGYG